MRISDWSSDVCSSDLDIEGARHDAVRVDMPAVRAAGFQDIDPQAVEPQRFRKVEMARFCEAAHFFVEQALEVGKGGVALRQIVEARIARIDLVAVRAAPPAPRAILFGKQAAALIAVVEQK